jgi:hypothetical protein
MLLYMEKLCKTCSIIFPISNFGTDNRAKDKHLAECKTCTSLRKKANYAKNPEIYRGHRRKFREQNLILDRRRNFGHSIKRLYGITLDIYDAMMIAQGGCCAICSTSLDEGHLHVDHDHETGEVRGLLCRSCNIGIGVFKENKTLLLLAIDYLEKYKKKQS